MGIGTDGVGGRALELGQKEEMRKGRPRLKKRELPQQTVPSSSSWSLGSVLAAFILLSQNKTKESMAIAEDLQSTPHLDLAHNRSSAFLQPFTLEALR